MNKQPLPSNRSFGLAFVALFSAFGIYSWWRGGDAYPLFLVLALLVGMVALFRASLLTPFNKAWMKFGEMLHRVISPMVLGVIFFGVITPFGIVMRLAGRPDIMRRKYERHTTSYWIPREPPGPDSDSLRNQF